MFIATLAGIFNLKDLPEEYSSFVQYKASLEKRDIEDNDEIAILAIQGTESYHVLFLKAYNNIREIEDELKLADAKINHTSLNILEGHL
ncbi:DUF749 domain-containing protein [Methanobacterium alkalithermotolerans]|uniref:DUF749 domain-containing protein n=1 Tax=Methanobacterium alkalithermotolerans TaxID=2731220 RepID=A0A8T8KF09_9EURY|nr:DUF749 domain-containing protein [Methanobacterium alkalithermotolerans]QUH23871.1 DUF749 domain-containing protein [Methanobacterium alkalithermotolerans]